jgi:hypothetical protein
MAYIVRIKRENVCCLIHRGLASGATCLAAPPPSTFCLIARYAVAEISLASRMARWLPWVSTSSFSSIASGRGECRDSHITTKPTHSYNSAHHTYIYIERARSSIATAKLAANRITPARWTIDLPSPIHRLNLAPAKHVSPSSRQCIGSTHG